MAGKVRAGGGFTPIFTHINSFYQKDAPEMGAVLDTIMLEKADRSA